MVNHSPNRKIKNKFISARVDITLTSLYNQTNLLSLTYSAVRAIFYFGTRRLDKHLTLSNLSFGKVILSWISFNNTVLFYFFFFSAMCSYKVQSSQLLILPGALDRASSLCIINTFSHGQHISVPTAFLFHELITVAQPQVFRSSWSGHPRWLKVGPTAYKTDFWILQGQELQFSSKKLALTAANPSTAILHI